MASSKSSSNNGPLEGDALIKETCRRIRAAKGLWDAHRNAACRNEREKALALYNQLTKPQKEKIPQQLRIWLRYRSEKYFGSHQTQPGQNKRSGKKRAGQKSSGKKLSNEGKSGQRSGRQPSNRKNSGKKKKRGW